MFSLLCLNACGSSDDNSTGQPPSPTIVAPTTQLGDPNESVANLQLKPGKLISINQVNTANCRRAVAVGMCIDIMASDNVVFASGMDDTKLEELFSSCGEAVRSMKADFWGLHLPYQTYDIAARNDRERNIPVPGMSKWFERYFTK